MTSTGGQSPENSTPSPFFFGYSALSIWRFAFYCLMAYNWYISYHGPFGRVSQFSTYNHAEWVFDFAPKTPEDTGRIRWFGVAVALVSTYSDSATVVFAILTGQHIFTNIILFINHNYLFFLLSTLMAFYCNCGKDNNHGKAGWIHALRGQIVVVYAFASLWKFDSDWLSGQIVKSIFLGFEKQGVHRGVPWSAMHESFPQIFVFIGLSGLILDFMVFVALMFLPPGHKLQALGFLFHGFTGYTMAQRIGYSFPLGMIFASLLFRKSYIVEKDQESLGGDTLSHAKWLALQMRLARENSNRTDTQHITKKRHLLPLLFLVVQWLIPLRMPLVSLGEFKHTFEGYRWSWTMMLHGKASFHSLGLSFMTLRPLCGSSFFPNPMADRNQFCDVQSIPYEIAFEQSPRSLSVVQMFPRQMPKVAAAVAEAFNLKSGCPFEFKIKTSYFSSTNQGAFHRLIDPTSDLMEVHRTHKSLPWLSKLWYAIIDKAPPGQEFILRGAGSIGLPLQTKNSKEVVTFVDRSSCLQVDPIRIHYNNFYFEFDSPSEVDFRLVLRGCQDVDLRNCKERIVNRGEKVRVPAIRTAMIGIDSGEDLGRSCSETTKEDVIIKLTNIATPA
eukprot:jgi/Psemu1/232921/e_gw1.5610.1.1